MSGFWGAFTYASGDRVPLRAVRCQSRPNDQAKRHTCRQHKDHVGDHRCVCGKKWSRSQAVSA